MERQNYLGMFLLGVIVTLFTTQGGINTEPQPACSVNSLEYIRQNAKESVTYDLMQYGCGHTEVSPRIAHYFAYDRLAAKRYYKHCADTDPNAHKPYCVYAYNNSGAVD